MTVAAASSWCLTSACAESAAPLRSRPPAERWGLGRGVSRGPASLSVCHLTAVKRQTPDSEPKSLFETNRFARAESSVDLPIPR